MSKQTVLIVEDDDDLRRLYRQSLSMAGYRVADVATAYKALRRLDTFQPDLILFDLMLPGPDGLAVLDELAANAHARTIPVLVLTAPNDVEGLHLDVACVLPKPVTNERLLKAVRDCLAANAPPARG